MVRSTSHALMRQAQRNLSADDVTFILIHGRCIRSGGALHVFLGRKDIPHDAARMVSHLEGTVLVMDDSYIEPVLITVYRNRKALKVIRSKTKYVRGVGRLRPNEEQWLAYAS
jgi:hypothetical protein